MASLLPQIKARFFDANNNPLSYGKVYTYEAGGSGIPRDTYIDFVESAVNPNPIVLDIEGSANIWLADGLPYKIVVNDSSDVLRYMADNVVVNSTSGGASSIGKVFLSALDPVSGFLSDKLLAGTNIELNITLNALGNTLTITIPSDPSFVGNVTGDTFNGGTLSGDNTGDQDLSSYVPYTGATGDVDLGANNLIVTGDIGSPTYTDYVNKIYSNQIRLDNLGNPTLNEKLLDVVQSNTTATATAVYLSNNGLGVAVDIIQENALASNQALKVTNDGLAEAITAITSGGEYAISATGGSIASINAQNGVQAPSYDSPSDQTQKRNGVTKLTHADTLTTIHQALDVQGSGTFDSIVTDVGGVTSATNYKLTNLTYNELVKYMYEARPTIVGSGSEDTTIFTSIGTGTNQVNFKLIRNNGGYFDRNLYVEQNQTIGGSQYITGTSRVNGATNYGSRTTEPTGTLVAGDKYYLSVGSIGWYTYSGTAWVKDGSGTFDDNIILPKETQMGVKVDTTTPTFPWQDLIGDVKVRGSGGADPSWAVYRDGIRQYQFGVNDESWFEFHIPHDYLEGSDMFIHVHWSHTTSGTPTGTVTWDLESTYAKGHQQQAFGATKTVSTSSTSALSQYTHMVTEVQLSMVGGSATMLNTSDIEVDGLILTRLVLSANSLSGGTNPFVHTVDIHYQSTGIGTKQKSPNFYV